MAQLITEAAARTPASAMVVLVGNYHSRPIPPTERESGAVNLVSALELPARVINLGAARGAYWACVSGDGCGPHLAKRVLPNHGLLDAKQVSVDASGLHTFERLVLPQFTPSFPAVQALGFK